MALRSITRLSGLLLLTLLFGCARLDTPAELAVQKSTNYVAAFGDALAVPQGWEPGVYEELVSAEAIFREQSTTRRRLVVEVLGFRAEEGVVIGTLEPPLVIRVYNRRGGLARTYRADEVEFEGALGAAGIDVRSGLPAIRPGWSVTIAQDQGELDALGNPVLTTLFEGEFE